MEKGAKQNIPMTLMNVPPKLKGREMTGKHTSMVFILLICLVLLGLSCKSTGPKTITPDNTKMVLMKYFTAGGKEIRVSPGPDNSAAPINDAIRSANPGDAIILNPGIYINKGPKRRGSEYEKRNNGPVHIEGKTNLLIKAHGDAYVFCDKALETPLEIVNSSNIVIEGIGFGHVDRGLTCIGGVSLIQNSGNILIRRCVLHGSGFFGVLARKSEKVDIEQCAIVECSYNAIINEHTGNLRVKECFIAFNDGSYYKDGRHGLLLESDNARGFELTGNMIFKNRTHFSRRLNCPEPNFIRNVFIANSFKPPDIIISPDGNKSLMLSADNMEGIMSRESIWPGKGPFNSAKAYLKFLTVQEKVK